MRITTVISKYVVVLSAGLWLSACSYITQTTGQPFYASGVAKLEAGESTFDDAVEQLGALPVVRYPQDDGSYLARWAHTRSVITDGVYSHNDIWLEFDAQDTFIRFNQKQSYPAPKKLKDQD